MKQLTLIRHSKTEVIYEGISDQERQLKTRGRKDARLIAQELKSKGCIPDLIISSNAIRAIQTAEEMAKVVNYPLNKITKAPFIYNGYTTVEFLDYIGQTDSAIQSIWVIGHNPEIALLGMNLTSENYFHFPTTATIVINYDVSQWHNIAAREGKASLYITPSMLKV